jgi:amino acid adenylation domain-containing protein/thioester reductase-like protein
VEQTNYPITVVAGPGKQLLLKMMYDQTCFDKATIERMLQHLGALLEQMVVNPEKHLSELSLMIDTERRQLLVEWNDTNKVYPKDRCIHELFEEQVQRTPDAVAVVFGEERLTYGELNQRANQLAYYLRAQGVEPETLVGICVERSTEMIVGLLGIMKAGAAYVPMDPAYPKDRIAYTLEDSKVSVLLTQERLAGGLSEQQAKVVCLDADWGVIEQHARLIGDEHSTSGVKADHLAYVIYTSGSTGRPKGVAIEHRSAVTLICWAHELYTPEDVSGVLASTSICFDLSVFEIFVPLGIGGKVIVAENALQLPTLSVRGEVTLVNTVPSAATELVRMGGIPSSVRTVNLAGEPLPNALAQQLYGLGTVQGVYNLYGPSEDTTYSTYALVEKGAQSAPTIGRPIANTQIYVLDAQLQLVPIGVPGELYIGGDGLARGYLNRPELTAERFIPHPFSDEPGARLYKTGDLVRYLPDGNIEYLGRIDHQVKIRGFRIELGEIEAVLGQHPAVETAVVISREDESGNKRLVGYVVAHQEQAGNISELRSHLKAKLPEYMVPSAWMMLERMPLTPNGKVDRKALPAPGKDRSQLTSEYVAPRTNMEKLLHDQWVEILKIDRIGLHDNFFEIGGQSILATQLIFKLREELQLEIPLRVLFDTPTIAGMALTVETISQIGIVAATKAVDVKNLSSEVELDDDIYPEQPFSFVSDFQCVLLTGATGFLGAFLLEELLRETKADIYCLVRAEDEIEGKKRIRGNLEYYGLWDEAYHQRIIPVVGDLSLLLLGLTTEKFDHLAEQIDVIYHNGALVNFAYPYAALKGANVMGTKEVLRLACKSKLKPVHFVSTLFVFPPDKSLVKIVKEEKMPDKSEGLTMGYTQSKWVAEKILQIARSRGIPISIYRSGRISGHSKTGACQPDDFIWRIIKSCIELGLAPKLNAKLDMMPVDYISQSIVRLSQDEATLGQNFHLLNPKPTSFSEFIKAIESLGYPLSRMSIDEWMTAIQQDSTHTFDNGRVAVGNILAEGNFKGGNLIFSNRKTLKTLTRQSIECPTVKAEQLITNLSHFIQKGFIAAPPIQKK